MKNLTTYQRPRNTKGGGCPTGNCDNDDTDDDQCVVTQSSVNLVQREYNWSRTDIYVNTQGGEIGINRMYYDGKWHWDHEKSNLTFEMDSLGTYIESIYKGGVEYEASALDSTIYKHETYI